MIDVANVLHIGSYEERAPIGEMLFGYDSMVLMDIKGGICYIGTNRKNKTFMTHR